MRGAPPILCKLVRCLLHVALGTHLCAYMKRLLLGWVRSHAEKAACMMCMCVAKANMCTITQATTHTTDSVEHTTGSLEPALDAYRVNTHAVLLEMLGDLV